MLMRGTYSKHFTQETNDLIKLVRQGHLFELQRRIASGTKVFREDLPGNRSLLGEAVDVGFHSTVEYLLNIEEWSVGKLTALAQCSLYRRREDIAQLLLTAGGKLNEIDFDALAHNLNFDLMERFLREGGEPEYEDQFAVALERCTQKPFLAFYMRMRKEFPILNQQASLALAETIRSKNLRWTSLLAWAGVDPYAKVPYSLGENWDDFGHSAAEAAAMANDAQYLKALRLSPSPSQARALLSRAAQSDTHHTTEAVLGLLSSSEVNDPESGSCDALGILIGKEIMHFTTPYPGFKYDQMDLEIEREAIRSIKLLVSWGAKWIPREGELRMRKRRIIERSDNYLTDLAKVLLYTKSVSCGLRELFKGVLLKRVRARDPKVAKAIITDEWEQS